MSVMVTVEFKFKPEAAEAMLAALKSSLPDTRAYAGCEEVKSYYEADTHSLLLVELWQSADHQKAYLNWRMETGMMDNIGDALAAAPIFRTFDIRDDI
jgi:quinol monooxygenase YgiN